MKRDSQLNIMFNLILKELPDKIDVGGLIFDINTDFRTCIKLQLLIEDKDLSENSKIKLTCKLFLQNQFEILEEIDYREAFIKLLDFYMCGEEIEKERKGNNKGVIYSFEHDSKYIYASFMQAYNINLNEIKMHWFEFKVLFDALPSDTIFNKILGYRSINLSDKNLTNEQRKIYKDLKEQYSLPDMRTVEQKEIDFVEALW